MRNVALSALVILFACVTLLAAPHDLSTPISSLSDEPRQPLPGYGGGDGDDATSDDEDCDEPLVLLARHFESDPLSDPQTVVVGQAEQRLTWNDDLPAFPGDRPGSLSALYDSNQPAGLYGFSLEATLAEDRAFTAAAIFVIEAEGFEADPNGFFQISWGLWNSATTGLNRTGSFVDFAADSFELIEFDYYPNVSSLFGGPFLAPTSFGEAVGAPPDAFANFTSLFGLEVGLPLGVPLLAVLEHRPEDGALVLQVHRVLDDNSLVPVNGAVGYAPLQFLSQPLYEVDTIGLTLWNDGFGGPVAALVATVRYHALVLVDGTTANPEELLDAAQSQD